LGPLEERLEREFRFFVLDHRLDFQGICHRCKDKRKPGPSES
jgi:Fur family ferric uptake transcriptional regulator